MELHNIDFLATNLFSKKFNDSVSDSHSLSIEKIHSLSEKKKVSSDDRKLLSKVLMDQYKGISEIKKVSDNIKSIEDVNTYTITTGHQLNIFTGPLYVIYKIVSTIKLTQELNNTYPDKHYVPVYWMASEDHDFKEIQSFQAFGKNYTWDINPTGAVGKIDPKSIKSILDELPEKISLFEDAYLKSKSLSEAVRKYMHSLFGSYGLVVIDANSKRLKKCFAPIIKDDIINNSIKNISKDKEEKPQVHVREINFFYMGEGMRERIVFSNNCYTINNTDIVFSEEEILKEIEKNPEKFSPNVITRCLYQEHILPNVCYIGGPAEVTYWLEFKSFFDKYKINYPVVMPRDFVLLLTKRSQKIVTKYGIELSQLFEGKKNVIETILNIYSDNKNNFDDEIKTIKEAYESLVDKYSSIDKSMSGNVQSKSKKTIKSIIELEKKYKKAQKSSNAKLIQDIDNLYGSLFGNNSSQERYDNFLNYYASDETFIATLVDILNPLVLNYKIIKL